MHKIAIVIDAQHLRSIASANGFQVDYRRFKPAIATRGTVVRAYFIAMVDEAQEFRSYRPLLDWLTYNGYATIEIRGRDPVALTERFVLTALAASEWCNEIVLVTGRYPALVNALMTKGVRVTVLSDARAADDALRRAPDAFIDISDLQSQIERADR